MIARDGYHRARLVDVARDAGLTTGAIYSNFRDKEELFLAAFERVQGLSNGLFDEVPGDLDGMLSAYRQAAERFENSTELQVLNFELALLGARTPRVKEFLVQGLRDTVAAVAERLPAAAGRSDADRTTAAALMVALGNGLGLIRMFAPDLVPDDLVEASLRRLVTEALG